MQTCLTFPNLGYYTNPENSVFGARGDFITSPEISQVFGEVVSRTALKANNGEKPVQLKEISLVEASPAMRAIQEEKLRDFASRVGCELNWHDTLSSVNRSDAFTMIVAHEFFDALPFYLLQKSQDGWREVMVASTLDPIKDPRLRSDADVGTPLPPSTPPSHDGPLFQRVLSPTSNSMSRSVFNLSPHLAEIAATLPIGAFLEVSVESYFNAAALSQLIGRPKSLDELQVDNANPPLTGGGCGLIVDYGDNKAFGNSFRAFKGHKIVDVFHQPGKTDLTANVDFALLQQAMGAQGTF
ncbi:hypothetical protein C0992_000641 [Termitomyces sp. T32_za158]|nr:hypothetical protein C0992_000641 [Termitomyces sp. T32_za158]